MRPCPPTAATRFVVVLEALCVICALSSIRANSAFKPQSHLSDVLSVLAMTMAEEGARDSLKYKLEGSGEDSIKIGDWGHEYIRSVLLAACSATALAIEYRCLQMHCLRRHLSGEISQEYAARSEKEQKTDDLSAFQRCCISIG